VNLITVQHLLGHASIAMTMRYAHLAPGQEAEAVERLSQGESIIKSIMAPSGAIGENR
jgi:integrase